MKLYRYLLLSTLFCLAFINFTFAQGANLDSLYKALAKSNADTNKVNTTIRICKELLLKGELDTALTYLANAKELSQTLNFNRGLGNVLTMTGRVYQKKNDLELALEYFTKAYKVREKAGNNSDMCGSLNEMGNIYKRMKKFDKALECYQKSLKLSKTETDKRIEANALMNIGSVYYNQGQYPEALNYYFEALKNYEKAGELANAGRLLMNVGIIYEIQLDYDKALDYYKRSFTIKEKTNDIDGMAATLSCLANAYYGKKDYDNSLIYNLKALEMAKKTKDEIMSANLLNNIGNIYAAKGDIEKALEHFYKSLNMRQAINDQTGIAESFHQISSMLYKQKKYNEAVIYGEKSIALMKELGDPELLKDVQLNLSGVYEAKKDGMNALKYYKEYISIRDTLFNEENTKKTVEAQMNYEFEKKEQETKLISDKKEAVAREQIKQQTLQRNFFIAGFILTIILGSFIYKNYREKKAANIEISIQKKEVEHKNHIIEEKQKEILDSINYAKRIQYTLLAHADFLKANIPNHFVFFNPKDIVSGDFYWAAKKGNKFYLAVCDSTGHGVPGAFMSLLNIGFLTEAINEKGIEEPNKVFDFVRQRLIDNISKEGQKDGFDGILLCIEALPSPVGEGAPKERVRLTYSAANNAPVLIQNNTFIELESDRMPVGMGERKENFKLFTIEAKTGDSLYLYTDGYADQFGGPKGKKFKYKPLNELLVSNCTSSLQQQSDVLKQTFENWRGDLEQVDDVCVIGIKL